MFRPAFRAACAARAQPRARQIGRRFASTSSTKSGSWKGTALRWTAAAAVVYYYNTATFFAEEPPSYAPLETPHGSEQYETVDAIAEHRRAQARAQIHASQPQEKTESQQSEPVADGGQVAIDGPGALEEEAEQQGAFNEETGEINWDCPCLGGMAHGPCGEQFRAAFSCFVYSKVEPKGVDCIEQFKTMQNCFREHPDIYGAELDDVEVAEAQAEEDDGEASLAQTQASSSSRPASIDRESETQRVPESQQPSEPASETDAEVPKARHDGRSSVEE